jgi:hypothetical protein
MADLFTACRDCGVDTFEINEYYMLLNEIWQECIPEEKSALLCIKCVEKRLGRKLTSADFSVCPLNTHPADVTFPNLKSNQLLLRLGHLKTKQTKGVVNTASFRDVLCMPTKMYHKFIHLCYGMLPDQFPPKTPIMERINTIRKDWYQLEKEYGLLVHSLLIMYRLREEIAAKTGAYPTYEEALAELDRVVDKIQLGVD